MDTKVSNQSGSDDAEIAKVLAGVNEQIEKDANTPTELHFEETPASNTPSNMPDTALPPTPSLSPISSDGAGPALPPVPPITPSDDTPVATDPAPASVNPKNDSQADPSLEGIKKDALNELRPLVDKLNVSPDEKFDTYLLLLRSTDDKSLIAPAHEAAKAITDEARRAQALLDIIKEIDYLSQPTA